MLCHGTSRAQAGQPRRRELRPGSGVSAPPPQRPSEEGWGGGGGSAAQGGEGEQLGISLGAASQLSPCFI